MSSCHGGASELAEAARVHAAAAVARLRERASSGSASTRSGSGCVMRERVEEQRGSANTCGAERVHDDDGSQSVGSSSGKWQRPHERANAERQGGDTASGPYNHGVVDWMPAPAVWLG